MLMDSMKEVSISMPCAPMPVPERDAPAFMHKCLVTSLTGNQTYYMRGGLIPHLTKKGCFWKSQAPAIHTTVLKYGLHIDAVNSAHLSKMDKVERGWAPPLPRAHHHFDGATGLHLSLDDSDRASSAPPVAPFSRHRLSRGLHRQFQLRVQQLLAQV